MAKGDLVYTDIETTGLDWEKHHAIEIAYMTDKMTEPKVIIPWSYGMHIETVHIWKDAAPVAMEINRFYERYPNGVDYSSDEDVNAMIETMTGSTLVGANVRFDARFIEKFIGGHEVWHHRLFDLQAYAAGVFDWDAPRGWNDICNAIVSAMQNDPFAYKFSPFDVFPDHSAAADTLSVKNAYHWLKAYRKSLERN